MTRRVVITGVGCVTPIGNGYDSVCSGIRDNRSGVVAMDEWRDIPGLSTILAAPADVDVSHFPRKKVRTMGRVGRLAAVATEQAIADAGLSADDMQSPRTGLAYGSTHGSTSALEGFCQKLFTGGGLGKVAGTAYLKFMSNTCAVNLAVFCGIRGQVHSPCSACVSGSQAIGLGFDLIRQGAQDVMVCGGAEELHYLHAGVFDIVFATSTANDSPDATPRPFDAHRDGLVVGEGAGTLILESYDRAKARGATIYGEILGYGTCCDGTHVTAPSADGMANAMSLALQDSGVAADSIGYINAHATATARGDIAESEATRRIYGQHVPVSSTKGNTGHTLGACGVIETVFCLHALRDGFLPANRNLENVDEECAALDYILESREVRIERATNNNFAFGGINTSLIFGRV